MPNAHWRQPWPQRLARELECPVIAVAELSRQVEQRKNALLSDLRKFAQIEADADP